MSKGYYLTQIEKISTDPQYDARLTGYLLGAVRKMAREDRNLEYGDFIEISEQIGKEKEAILTAAYIMEVDA